MSKANANTMLSTPGLAPADDASNFADGSSRDPGPLECLGLSDRRGDPNFKGEHVGFLARSGLDTHRMVLTRDEAFHLASQIIQSLFAVPDARFATETLHAAIDEAVACDDVESAVLGLMRHLNIRRIRAADGVFGGSSETWPRLHSLERRGMIERWISAEAVASTRMHPAL